MIPIGAGSFAEALRVLRSRISVSSERVPQVRWQGKDVSEDPSAECWELRGVEISVDMRGIEDLDHWRRDIEPNLPWADDHFLERVSREPLNPGEQWRMWPWASSADKFRAESIFNHTYMERLWPRYARMTEGGIVGGCISGLEPRRGIAWEYGDLDSLVDLLVRDPYTRQAWIPLFFPEDTGWGDGGRKPCTLGYQFLVRGGKMNIWYPLRSCDFSRHLRDDCYMAVRLLLWILSECRTRGGGSGGVDWGSVSPGEYSMHVTSMHVFANDAISLGIRKG